MTTGHESAGERAMDGVKQDSKEERHNAERDTGVSNRTTPGERGKRREKCPNDKLKPVPVNYAFRFRGPVTAPRAKSKIDCSTPESSHGSVTPTPNKPL
jgi:hypothetical protein